ncbi:MAG: right-handed parallel beta-helix repeat-containing protein [Myxococcales bacterium]|nr:right-handed parallel beta-helix repeat-containing protein [Myxococcales bacterium]
MSPTRRAAVIALLATAACSGDAGPVRDPISFDAPYRPPADRIDPTTAATWDDAAFRALGAARAARPPALPATTAQRYVSAATGDDGDDGSAAAPWQTLRHAAEVVEPDTTVWLDASGDYQGGVRIDRGGADGAWVVFAAMPGARPRVVGDPSADAVIDIDASWVVVAGLEIADHQRAGLADTYGIQVATTTDDISHVQLLGNLIHDIGPGVLEQPTCAYDGHGIIAQSQGHRIGVLTIDGNELHDVYAGTSEILVVNGLVEAFRVTNNYVHDVDNIAIDIIGYEQRPDETTSNGLVADNVVLDASNYWPYCTRGNCGYPVGDESSDGIYVDGGADLIIEHNVVGRADHGIELQSENGELIRDTEVRFNLVFNSNYKNLTIGASARTTEHDNVLIDDPRLADPDLEACRP